MFQTEIKEKVSLLVYSYQIWWLTYFLRCNWTAPLCDQSCIPHGYTHKSPTVEILMMITCSIVSVTRTMQRIIKAVKKMNRFTNHRHGRDCSVQAFSYIKINKIVPRLAGWLLCPWVPRTVNDGVCPFTASTISVLIPLVPGNCFVSRLIFSKLCFASKNRKLPYECVFFMHTSVHKDLKPLFNLFLYQMVSSIAL